MPLFYFNLFDDEPSIDDQGTELGSLGEAFTHAADLACACVSLTARQGYVTLGHYVEIANYARECVGRLRFGDAVELRD